MQFKITPRLIDLTYESALKAYWRKEALRKFLRASHISESFLSSWNEDESKRAFLDRVFQNLQKSDNGKSVIIRMARSLSEQTTFPDLNGWEDSKQKLADATSAVQELRSYLLIQDQEIESEKEREQARREGQQRHQKIQRALTDRTKLQQRLDAMHSAVGTQSGGYEFQEWFYDVIDFCELQNRRPYTSDGRQIDGSITHEGTTYLVELKFTATQSGASDIDSLRSKVDDKADNTMGIVVSISGYSSVAINQASGRKTTLLLFDAAHLYHFLSGVMSFGDIISRVRRHASQTGEAYLPPKDFGG